MSAQVDSTMKMAELVVLLAGCLVSLSTASDLPATHDSEYLYSDMGDWSKDWAMLSGRLQQPKCIDIPANLSLCRNIGYNQMRLPNLLDHDTIREVTSQAASWRPLLGIRCHPDTKLFLCSLFSPVCLDRPIWPCRSLCDTVKASCEGFMNKYGFPWPEMLRCDKFPLDNDLCIGVLNDAKADDQVCEPCNKPDTFEGIVHNFCSADIALKLRLRENVIVGRDMKIIPQNKKKVLKKGGLTKSDLRNLQMFIADGEGCECPAIDDATGPAKPMYLMMGSKREGRVVLSYVNIYNKRNKEFRRAMRAIRKQNICKSGLHAITGDSAQQGQTPSPSQQSTRPSTRPSGRNNPKRKRGRKTKRARQTSTPSSGNGNRNERRNRKRKGHGRSGNGGRGSAGLSLTTVTP